MKNVFLDTNLIVYADDRRDPVKQRKAQNLIAERMRNGTGVISTQVMQEYAAVALNELHQRHDVVLQQLLLLEALKVISLSPALIRRMVEIKAAYMISFWGSSIIAAAEYAGCQQIYSKDFNTGQFYADITIVDPF